MPSSSTQQFELFGNYVLLELLASGGMAEVFLARPANCSSNGRVLVVKRILKHIADDPVFIGMFRSEIRMTLGFNHPHTIQVHDFGEIDFQPYIAMEYIEGKSLKQIAEKFEEKKELIPVPTVLGLIAQAANGLAYAHHFENPATGEIVNAVHRDISPHNLILSYHGNLKVIDFGIAKAKDKRGEGTKTGLVKGKCGYLSPEQLRGENLDGRSDVFSLGIVAWELLTCQKLFQKPNETEYQVIKRIENCELNIAPPSSINPEVPKEVDEAILKALQKNPADRYTSAAQFQETLRKLMRQFYPKYAYADSAQIMQTLFESEMLTEREGLRKLNDAAQKVLTAAQDTKTKEIPTKKGIFSLLKKFRSPVQLPSVVEVRMEQLEAQLKQKASSKHMLVGLFYILSLAAIKFDERYEILDRLFLPADVYHEDIGFQQAMRMRRQARVAHVALPPAPKVAPAQLQAAQVRRATLAARSIASSPPANTHRKAKKKVTPKKKVRPVT